MYAKVFLFELQKEESQKMVRCGAMFSFCHLMSYT